MDRNVTKSRMFLMAMKPPIARKESFLNDNVEILDRNGIVSCEN